MLRMTNDEEVWHFYRNIYLIANEINIPGRMWHIVKYIISLAVINNYSCVVDSQMFLSDIPFVIPGCSFMFIL